MHNFLLLVIGLTFRVEFLLLVIIFILAPVVGWVIVGGIIVFFAGCLLLRFLGWVHDLFL